MKKQIFLLVKVSNNGTKYTTLELYETREEAEANIPFFKSFFYDYIIEPYFIEEGANIKSLQINIK